MMAKSSVHCRAEVARETGIRFDGERFVVDEDSDEFHGDRLRLIKPTGHHGSPIINEDQIVDGDFRNEIDQDQHCSCFDRPDVGDVCPHCRHPGIRESQILLFRALPVLLFNELKLKTKRQEVAYTDSGAVLPSRYCAVFIDRAEMEDIILRFALPKEYFL